MNGRHDSTEPKDWLCFAEADLRTAEHTFRTLEPCPYWIVAYHAQQCVEKALKGYLIGRKRTPPYTHDLRLLFDLCETAGAEWVKNVRSAEKLMSLSVMERYPSNVRTVSREDAETSLTHAGAVLRAVVGSIASN